MTRKRAEAFPMIPSSQLGKVIGTMNDTLATLAGHREFDAFVIFVSESGMTFVNTSGDPQFIADVLMDTLQDTVERYSPVITSTMKEP